MKHYSVNEILNGIRQRSDKILHYVYHENYPAVKTFISKNSGNSQDAKDIFQEGLVVVYKRVSSAEFTLNCSFKTYIFSVCRLLWLKELEKRKSEKMDQKDLKGYLDLQAELNFSDAEHEKYRLYQKHLEQMDPDCQRVLTLYYDGASIRDITRIMGYSSESYTKKKKFKCKEKLIGKIKNDPDFKSIVDLS